MIPPWFADVLARYARVAIVGGPGTGKSTLASYVDDRPVLGTDGYTDVPWAMIPRAVINAVSELGPRWCIEGCQVARCLRKGLRPDVVVVLRTPRRPLTDAQATFGKGVMTILAEVRGSGLTFIEPQALSHINR